MADAIDKTKSLKRVFIKSDLLIPNPGNPNEMSTAEFNLLYENIGLMGITDPILVRPHPQIKGKYRIVGGEHRWEVSKLYDMDEVPCTIVEDPEFDEDHEKFQMVRHNIIHGKMSPQKFFKLYESLSEKYTDKVAAEAFGFVEEEEFKKFINKTASALPKNMQKDFKEAAKELKTIDELSNLLNTMFTNYGDSLTYGYMILDYGGKKSIWLRLLGKEYQNFLKMADTLKENNKTVDHFFEKLLQLIANDTLPGFSLEDFIKDLPEMVMVKDVEVPSLDFLDE